MLCLGNYFWQPLQVFMFRGQSYTIVLKVRCTHLVSLSSLAISFFCFFLSSRSLSASACSLTARSRSRRNLSHSVRILSRSSTILSRSLNAQSRLLLDTSASWRASEMLQWDKCHFYHRMDRYLPYSYYKPGGHCYASLSFENLQTPRKPLKSNIQRNMQQFFLVNALLSILSYFKCVAIWRSLSFEIGTVKTLMRHNETHFTTCGYISF